MLEFKIFMDKVLIQKAVLSKGQITIGRSADNDLVLPNKHVSRLHVVIRRDGETFILEDRSTNGVLLDGERVQGITPLPPRCRLEIYPYEIDCLRQQEDRTIPISKKEIESPPPQTPVQETSSPSSTLSYHFGILVGESSSMHRVYQLIQDVAQSPATVSIRGEHGTGKELVARAVHEESERREKPFIAVNCAAIPLDLIESELFGYEKGAFTGAQTFKKGKVEEADGGTLFLDEIGELNPAAQAKLLRFLQEKAFTRLGGAREIPIDVRVIAATNKNLERAIQDGTFRADLYYRIKVVQIDLPPLREHPEDIPLLATHILNKLVLELKLSTLPLVTREAMDRLQSGRWPGNVRQLENVLYSAVIRSRSPHLLDEELLLSDSTTWANPPEGKQEEETPLDQITKQLLIQILKENQWDTQRAAEILKVSRGTIYYKLKKYGIDLRETSRKGLKL
jgi:transcriptional regulator with PAS, ATPase and Fis domain